MRSRRTTALVTLCAGLGLALGLSACGTVTTATDGTTQPPAAHPVPEQPSRAATPAPSRSGSPTRQSPGTSWGPTAAELTRARGYAHRMSVRRLAGQVIVARYSGTGAPTAMVDDLHLGGVIVMGDNIAGTDRLRRSNQALQRAAADAGRRWPVFVGVDQEGGLVERVQGEATRFPAFMTAGAARDPQVTSRAAAASGGELAGLGFTAVFAPDADVTSGPDDPTIGSRSAGSHPRLVASQMNAAVSGFRSAGLVPVIKHFPGHGSVPTDSHIALPVQRKSLAELSDTDLVPFAAGVAAGVPAVMVAHIDVRAIDPGVPSSLSRKVVTGLLRQRLGFQGLVVTDALNMGAITQHWSSARSAVKALRAGADVLLMPPSPRAARDGIVAAVRSGALKRSRLEDAAARQIALLLHQQANRPAHTRKPGSSRAESYALSAAGVTMVSGPCRGRLVGRSVRASGPADTVAAFDAAARRAGLGTGSGTSVALVGYRGAARSADVVVSTDTPYVLARSRARTARIALYGDTPGAMRALVAVLLGKATAPGRLPVPVRGHHPSC